MTNTWLKKKNNFLSLFELGKAKNRINRDLKGTSYYKKKQFNRTEPSLLNRLR